MKNASDLRKITNSVNNSKKQEIKNMIDKLVDQIINKACENAACGTSFYFFERTLMSSEEIILIKELEKLGYQVKIYQERIRISW